MNGQTGATWHFVCCMVILSISLSGFAVLAEEPAAGYVDWVADGDTLVLRSGAQRRWVRLAHIDAPERDQPHGLEATRALEALVLNRRITVKLVDRDRHGRSVCRVYSGGNDVNAALVRDGHAWVYRKYTNDGALYRLERTARAQRRGLWHDPDAVPPWSWRSGELE